MLGYDICNEFWLVLTLVISVAPGVFLGYLAFGQFAGFPAKRQKKTSPRSKI
jgi:hypothetical protein